MSKQSTEMDGELSLESMVESFNAENKVEPLEISKEIKEILPENKETEEEKPVETIKEEDKEELQETVMAQSNSSFEKAKTLIELGLLEDAKIAIGEDDEGVKLSEFKDLTEDQLQAVLKDYKDSKDKELQENYIPKEGLDEDNLKIIEVLKNGGSIKDLFETPEEAIRPFQGLDLDEPRNQGQVLFDHYTKYQGLDPDDALALVKKKLDKGDLEEAAKGLHKAYNEAYDKNLEAKKQQFLLKKEEEKQRLKDIRTSLSSKLKEANYKEPISKKIIESVTKPNTQGILPVQEAFNKLLKNPEENYEKLLHILDDKAFNDIYKIKSQKKEGLKIIKILDEAKNDKKRQIASDRQEVGQSLFDEIANIKI